MVASTGYKDRTLDQCNLKHQYPVVVLDVHGDLKCMPFSFFCIKFQVQFHLEVKSVFIQTENSNVHHCIDKMH